MGRRIAQLRERAHLTQEAAADRAGVTLRAYQKWEAGGGIQYGNLQKLADALRTSIDNITGEAETPSPFRVEDQLQDVRGIESRLERVEAMLLVILDRLQVVNPDVAVREAMISLGQFAAREELAAEDSQAPTPAHVGQRRRAARSE